MKRSLLFIIPALLIGIEIGLIFGVRWVLVLTSMVLTHSIFSSSFNYCILFIIALLGLIAVLVGRIWRPGSGVFVGYSIALIAGVSVYATLSWIYSVMQDSLPIISVLGPVFGVSLFIILMFKNVPIPASFCLLTGLSALQSSRSAEFVFGDHLAREAFKYSAPPSAIYYISLILSLFIIGCFTGCFAAYLNRLRKFAIIILGGSIGVIFALCISIAQTIMFFAAMQSGQNPWVILFLSLITWTGLAAGIMSFIHFYKYRQTSSIFKFASIPIFLLISTYIFISGYGYSRFRSINSLYPDLTYAYIHFRGDGTWRRTLDQSASNAKTWRAEEFVTGYRESAYRPAAMLILAQCLFEQWQFQETSSVLEEYKRDYPYLIGNCDILHTLSDLADSRPRTILAPTHEDSYFALWRRTQGAQLAANAAERLGMIHRAVGFNSAYIDYLLGQQGTLWTAESISFSKVKIEFLNQNSLSIGGERKGKVTAIIDGPYGPIRGARIVLVQSHPDAALPSDSKQFTGAWTIPAWNGMWSLTDKNGRASIENVPFGNYEVVVGLNFATTPYRTVVSSAIPLVRVESGNTTVKPIHLTPAVNLISPKCNAVLSRSPVLLWERYPGAASYAVSIIELMDRGLSTPGIYPQPKGITCWARSGIRSNSTHIDSSYFLNQHASLKKGHSYMWLVYAYGQDGRLLSSSEHYFELAEQMFTIK